MSIAEEARRPGADAGLLRDDPRRPNGGGSDLAAAEGLTDRRSRTRVRWVVVALLALGAVVGTAAFVLRYEVDQSLLSRQHRDGARAAVGAVAAMAATAPTHADALGVVAAASSAPRAESWADAVLWDASTPSRPPLRGTEALAARRAATDATATAASGSHQEVVAVRVGATREVLVARVDWSGAWERERRTLLGQLFVSVLLLGLGVGISAWVLFHFLVRPLEALARVARGVARGEAGEPSGVVVRGPAELAETAGVIEGLRAWAHSAAAEAQAARERLGDQARRHGREVLGLLEDRERAVTDLSARLEEAEGEIREAVGALRGYLAGRPGTTVPPDTARRLGGELERLEGVASELATAGLIASAEEPDIVPIVIALDEALGALGDRAPGVRRSDGDDETLVLAPKATLHECLLCVCSAATARADAAEVTLSCELEPETVVVRLRWPDALAPEEHSALLASPTQEGGLPTLHRCRMLAQSFGGRVGLRTDLDATEVWLELPRANLETTSSLATIPSAVRSRPTLAALADGTDDAVAKPETGADGATEPGTVGDLTLLGLPLDAVMGAAALLSSSVVLGHFAVGGVFIGALLVTVGIATAGLCLRNRRGESGAGWAPAGGAALAMACAQGATVAFGWGPPSPADGARLVAYPLGLWALWRLGLRFRGPAATARVVLDAFTVVIALLVVSWIVVLGPASHMARSDQALAHPLTTALLIGYPALDVVLVAGAALLAAHVWDRAGTWPVWLALGLGLFGIADSTAAVARLRGADAGMNGTLWMAALLALGAGALVWRRSRREMHPTQATTLSHEAAPSVGARMVPYAVVVGAVAVYALAPAQDRQGLAITVLTILGGVVIAARELVGVIHEARAKQHLAGRLEIQQRTTDALRASLADWDRAVWVRRDLLERARERMRTPVMSMLGMLDLLEGQVQTDYERSEVVTLRLGLVQLLNAIDDLVEVSDPELARVGEGGTRSLIDIGERAVEMLEALAVQNGVRIDHEHEATAGPGGHSVHVPSGAAALMQRVARELLVHAVTNASHLVRLRLEPTGEGGVRLLVIDDRADITGGSGRDVVDRHLVERELAVEPELALAAQLVESAGGKLTAETRPGISRTVVAWLPGPGGLLWGGGVDDVSGSPG